MDDRERTADIDRLFVGSGRAAATTDHREQAANAGDAAPVKTNDLNA